MNVSGKIKTDFFRFQDPGAFPVTEFTLSTDAPEQFKEIFAHAAIVPSRSGDIMSGGTGMDHCIHRGRRIWAVDFRPLVQLLHRNLPFLTCDRFTN